MNKRSFLRGLFAVLGAGVAADTPAQPQRRILIQVSPLAGFQYHAGGDVRALLAVGQPLSLARDPDNAHDERAVRVDWRGQKFGYLPRMENTAVAQMLDRGELLDARITALQASPDPWERLTCAVELST